MESEIGKGELNMKLENECRNWNLERFGKRIWKGNLKREFEKEGIGYLWERRYLRGQCHARQSLVVSSVVRISS